MLPPPSNSPPHPRAEIGPTGEMPGQNCVPTDPASRVCTHTPLRTSHTVSFFTHKSIHRDLKYPTCRLYAPGQPGNTTEPEINRGLSANWDPGLPSLGLGLSGAAEIPVYAWVQLRTHLSEMTVSRFPALPLPGHQHSLCRALLPGTWCVLCESCCKGARPAEAETAGRWELRQPSGAYI